VQVRLTGCGADGDGLDGGLRVAPKKSVEDGNTAGLRLNRYDARRNSMEYANSATDVSADIKNEPAGRNERAIEAKARFVVHTPARKLASKAASASPGGDNRRE